MSGLLIDLTLWPMPMISRPSFFILLTNSMGSSPLSNALLNCLAAASRAPPNRSPMVRRPEVRLEMRSLPARAQTMVLCAPETAGP
uniref:Uncharacterized protein n=1 Tax=Anguilla anguilla TaxID=7936 RepID=A0A0E9S871_ANGAN